MRVAISTDGQYVSPHFGRCPFFTLVNIENKKVVKKEKIKNPGHSTDFIPQFLHNNGVDMIVCGGIGSRAANLFEKLDIVMITGIEGNIYDVIEELVKGTLESEGNICTPGKGRGYGINKIDCDHV